LQEGDIQAGLKSGGHVHGSFIVERRATDGPVYVVYLRTSWKRGFHALRTYRDRSDRVYRDLGRLLRLIRDEFQFQGPVTIFVAGDPELQRFRALLPQDGERVAGDDTAEAKTSEIDPAELSSPQSDTTDTPVSSDTFRECC
jgi:hypothetical protein